MTIRLVILVVAAALVAGALYVRSRRRPVDRGTRQLDTALLPCGTLGAAVWVLFSTPYCVPCRRIVGLFADAELPLVHVGVDDEPELVAVLDVRRSPTLVHVAADGTVLARHEGPDAVVAARRLAGQETADVAIA